MLRQLLADLTFVAVVGGYVCIVGYVFWDMVKASLKEFKR